MSKVVLLLFCFFSSVLPISATPLRDLAQSMAPGTWAELNTNNFTRSGVYGKDGFVDLIVNYSDNAVWDTAANELLFLGGGHRGPIGFIKYSASTNAWSKLPLPPFHVSHAYQNNAIDQENRILYHNPGNTRKVYPYDIATGTWGSSLPDVPGPQGQDIGFGSAMDFFPELGGLVRYRKGNLRLFKLSTGTWSTLATGLSANGYHNILMVNPVHKAVLMGGGNYSTSNSTVGKKIHRLDASGTITQLGNAPIDLSTAKTAISLDPVSGDYLVAGKDGKFYSFDITSDVWTDLGVVPWAWDNNLAKNFTIATPIWNEGVAMFAWANPQGPGSVFLYKTSAIPDLGLSGDFDSDGDVDGNDFLLWQRNPAVGDLSTWQTRFGNASAIAANTSIPEPSSLLLMVASTLLMTGRSNFH